jgi:protoporphyrinogen/coproporphyrinogen III oxidase
MSDDPMASSTSRPHVVVVGGGIAGLAAAERLVAAGVRLTLVEATPRIGGAIGTDAIEGFLVERGPDVMVAAKPAGRMLAERVGLGGRLQGTAVRGGYVFRHGRLKRLPEGLTGLLPSRLAPIATSGLLSPLGLLRLATEPLRRSRADLADESVESFMTRRLGRETYERLCEPLLTGIYSGKGSRLSMEATLPQLRELEREHGSLLRGLRARTKAAPPRPAPSPSPFLSFPNGLQELVDALEATLDRAPHATIRKSTPVSAIVPPASRDEAATVLLATGESIECDAVLVATPAPVAARLLSATDAALGAELAAIEHGSTATIALGYDATAVRRPLDATGYVVPRTEGRAVMACTWVSSKHGGRAPAGMVQFRLFVGGAHRPELVALSDSELTAIARAELHDSLGISAEPRFARIGRWVGAMPQYLLGHRERVDRIEARERTHGWLALAGNAYRGVGVPDCIASGERAAARLVERLVGARRDAAAATAT